MAIVGLIFVGCVILFIFYLVFDDIVLSDRRYREEVAKNRYDIYRMQERINNRILEIAEKEGLPRPTLRKYTIDGYWIIEEGEEDEYSI